MVGTWSKLCKLSVEYVCNDEVKLVVQIDETDKPCPLPRLEVSTEMQ